jgi:hypothetical protein
MKPIGFDGQGDRRALAEIRSAKQTEIPAQESSRDRTSIVE